MTEHDSGDQGWSRHWEKDWGSGGRGPRRGPNRGADWQQWMQSWGAGGPGAAGGGPRGWAGGGGHRQGPPPWLQDLVRSFGGPDLRGGPRGPKARRGDVRAAVLAVLAGEPMNGYQIIQQISERTDGAWKPSPGSVYPTIQQLEDEELVTGADTDGRRLLTLTDAGRAWVEEHPDELRATWAPFQPGPVEATETKGAGRPDVKPVAGQVMSAVWQIMVSGTDQQRAEAVEILGETRRRLYGLLADGEPDGETEGEPDRETGGETGREAR